MRDVPLQRVHSTRRGLARPHIVGETVDGHDFVRVDRQHRENGALSQAAEWARAIIRGHAESTQQSDLHCPPAPTCRLPCKTVPARSATTSRKFPCVRCQCGQEVPDLKRLSAFWTVTAL